MTDPILADAKNVDQRNYLYARRKEQVARMALDGNWAGIRRVLNFIDAPTIDKESLAQAMWNRQVAPLDTCRKMAGRIILALEDIDKGKT